MAVAAQDGRGRAGTRRRSMVQVDVLPRQRPLPARDPGPCRSSRTHLRKRMDDHQRSCDDTPRRRHGRREDRLCSRRSPGAEAEDDLRDPELLPDQHAPIYFVGPTAFNLLGIDRWVRNFYYVDYYDSWDGTHPRVFVPEGTSRTSSSRAARRSTTTCSRTGGADLRPAPAAVRPKVAMVFFDEETERICESSGYELTCRRRAAPPARLEDRHHPARQRGRRAVRARTSSGARRLRRADAQLAATPGSATTSSSRRRTATPGKTTFFITAEARLGRERRATWSRGAEGDEADPQPCRGRRGGQHPARHRGRAVHDRPHRLSRTDPVQGRLVRQRPLPGGAVAGRIARSRIEHVRRLGDRLAAGGLQADSSRSTSWSTSTPASVYLGELNPRISGASSMTNVTAGAYADIPLFLFHLLEFMDVDYESTSTRSTSAGANSRRRRLGAADHEGADRLGRADPGGAAHRAPGISTDDGKLQFVRVTNDWHDVTHEDECFYLRVYAARATTASRAPTSASWSQRAGCRPADGLTERCRQYIDRHPLAVPERIAAGDTDGHPHRVRQVGAPSPAWRAVRDVGKEGVPQHHRRRGPAGCRRGS